MKTTMMITIAAAAAAFTGDASAVSINADTPILEAPYMVADSPVDERLVRAEELRREAESLFDDSKQWKRAAKLLEKSAELRPVTDPEAYASMVYAARLRSAANDAHGAHYAFEKAAKIAMARGEVLDAATAYIDAAFAASAAGRAPQARALLRHAEGLAESPELSDSERQILAAKIEGTRSRTQVSMNR